MEYDQSDHIDLVQKLFIWEINSLHLQMLRGLLHMMNAWRPSTEGAHFLDEDNKWLAGGRRSGKGGPAACIMKRMLALTRRQVLLSQHTPVLEALQRLVMLLQRRFSDCFPAGIYSYELRGLMHQVPCVVMFACCATSKVLGIPTDNMAADCHNCACLSCYQQNTLLQ